MSGNYGIPGSLLRFLRACVYGDARAYYAGLDEPGRVELAEQWNSFGMTAWAYRYPYDLLPETFRAKYRTDYQTRQLKAMMGAHELRRFFRVLAAHGLRFVPIKGADLAYRLYPDAALRTFGDWDIWFHPDDCERALTVLAEDGWSVAENYSDDHAFVRGNGAHHYSPFIRGGYILEPHFALSNFEGVDPYEMWAETTEYPDGDGQRVLTPELNLMMLARHAASVSYYHAEIPKLLADAAMVMRREKTDFAKLRALAACWRLPYAGDLLAAFPEFFPPDVLEGFGADPEKTAVFRRLFELRGNLGEPEGVSILMSRFEVQGRVLGGVWERIMMLHPKKIRNLYHLPKHGAWGRVAWSYVCWLWDKCRHASAWLRGSATMREYARMVETIESARGTAGRTAEIRTETPGR